MNLLQRLFHRCPDEDCPEHDDREQHDLEEARERLARIERQQREIEFEVRVQTGGKHPSD